MTSYDGSWNAGRIRTMFKAPGWNYSSHFEPLSWDILEPPWIWPYAGPSFDLLEIPDQVLTQLLEDAWMKMVSLEVSHRNDFQGVCTIDRPTVVRARQGLTAFEAAQIASLQEGTQKQRFDCFQTGLCH